MCGRFAQFSPVSLLKDAFDIGAVKCDPVRSSYNVAPAQDVFAVVHSGERILTKFFWGILPRMYKENTKPLLLINARLETIDEKPSFKNSFKYRRCLIPADGFYEWGKKDQNKRPWFFSLKSEEIFAFAGIWENLKAKDGNIYGSFVIITTTASESINKIHDRMPVILCKESHGGWLNPDEKNPVRLKSIIREGLIHELKGYPVSLKVNVVSNNDPSCIAPLNQSAKL